MAESDPKKAKRDFTTIEGYIHHVSPFKGDNSNYFEAQIQVDQNSSKRIVCFSPGRRKDLQTFAANRTGVQITGTRHEVDRTGQDKYVLPERIHLKPLQLDFTSSAAPDLTLDLAQLNDALLETPYIVSGQVVEVSITEKTSYRDMLAQKIILGQDNAPAKVVLWGRLCDTLLLNKSYTLTAVKVRIKETQRYLTTSPNTEVTDCGDIEISETLLNNIPSTSKHHRVCGRFISVKDVYIFITCPTCDKAISSTQDEIIECKHCRTSTLRDVCVEDGCILVNILEATLKTRLQLKMYRAPLETLINSTQSESSPSVDKLFKNIKTSTLFLLKLGNVEIEYDKDAMKVLTCRTI